MDRKSKHNKLSIFVATKQLKSPFSMLTVTKIEKCPNCGCRDIVKNGFTAYKNQRIKCKVCHKSPVLHRKKTFNYDRDCLIRSFLERLSLCGVSRVFAISYYRVYYELNLTCLFLPNFKSQVADCEGNREIIEFDELCGFCGKKANRSGVP